MSRFVKTFIISQVIALALVILFIVIFVGDDEYTNTLSADELLSEASKVIVTEGGTSALDPDVILEFGDNMPNVTDYSIIKANNSKNINEMGIFRSENENVEELVERVKKYVEDKKQTYRALDYFPEEAQKIDNATVKVYGNYVIYTFLNEKDTAYFYNRAENIIKK